MHDPMTVAFEIINPIYTLHYLWKKIVKREQWTYLPTILTIWHVDPETDYTDDSCGWSRPKQTDKDRETIKNVSERYDLRLIWKQKPRKIKLEKTDFDKSLEKEYEENPCEFLSPKTREWQDRCYFEPPVDFPLNLDASYTYYLIYNLFRDFKRIETNKYPILSKKELEEVHDLAYNCVDNLQHSCCDYEGNIESCFFIIYMNWKRIHRKWYQHPRWHIRHWKLQWHSPFKSWWKKQNCGCCVSENVKSE